MADARKQNPSVALSASADLITDRDFTLLLISLYRDNPVLWQVKNKEYKNKNKRLIAMENILKTLRIYKPFFTEDELKRKINMLRTNFNKEKNKIEKAKRSGASTDDIPQPVLWYYNDMLFLYDQMLISDTESSEQLPSQEQETQQKKRPKKTTTDELVDIATKYFKRPDNESDVIAKSWAIKLNRLEPDQRRYAEKIINDVLFEGEMGTLTRKGVCFLPETSTSYSSESSSGFYSTPSLNLSHAPCTSPLPNNNSEILFQMSPCQSPMLRETPSPHLSISPQAPHQMPTKVSSRKGVSFLPETSTSYSSENSSGFNSTPSRNLSHAPCTSPLPNNNSEILFQMSPCQSPMPRETPSPHLSISPQAPHQMPTTVLSSQAPHQMPTKVLSSQIPHQMPTKVSSRKGVSFLPETSTSYSSENSFGFNSTPSRNLSHAPCTSPLPNNNSEILFRMSPCQSPMPRETPSPHLSISPQASHQMPTKVLSSQLPHQMPTKLSSRKGVSFLPETSTSYSSENSSGFNSTPSRNLSQAPCTSPLPNNNSEILFQMSPCQSPMLHETPSPHLSILPQAPHQMPTKVSSRKGVSFLPETSTSYSSENSSGFNSTPSRNLSHAPCTSPLPNNNSEILFQMSPCQSPMLHETPSPHLSILPQAPHQMPTTVLSSQAPHQMPTKVLSSQAPHQMPTKVLSSQVPHQMPTKVLSSQPPHQTPIKILSSQIIRLVNQSQVPYKKKNEALASSVPTYTQQPVSIQILSEQSPTDDNTEEQTAAKFLQNYCSF